jgi:hypothetical protein
MGRLTVAEPDGFASPDGAPFEGGPPLGLQRRLGLVKPDRQNVGLRAALTIAVMWLPLLLITAAQSVLRGDGSLASFLSDYGAHARFLIAAPILVVAEATCLPRLSMIARHFHDRGLVEPRDAEAYRHAVASTVRLRDLARLEVVVLALAIALAAVMWREVPSPLYPAWHHAPVGARTGMSVAGWWHDLVSVPLLLMLLLGWAARLCLWARFLFLMSRLRLRLVAAHPDKAGGLKFVGMSASAFSIVAFAFGVIVAGTIANKVEHNGVPLMSFRYALAGFLVVSVGVFVAPLLVFTERLATAWRAGMLSYGALAHGVGVEMERKWFGEHVKPDVLDANDFSATTDLYSIVSNVYGMTLVPLNVNHVVVLAVSTLAPFLPLIFLAVPPDII